MEFGIGLKQFDTNLGIAYSPYASDALGKQLWVVKKDFNFFLDAEQNRRVVIPRGYLTDGASVPRPFWSFVPPWGQYGQAAVMHDWLCEYLRVWDTKEAKWIKITREECDNIFNDAMRSLGVSNTTRRIMYGAVKAYSHLASVVYESYDPKKREIEKELLSHYQLTKEWW